MHKLVLCAAIFLVSIHIASANFEKCLANINNMTIEGKTDNHGRLLPASSTNATAITYDLCVSQCGAGQEPFRWSVFSQQFSSWLAPWLALVSNLPFGANDKLDNLESMLLTVGSPTLATYSLCLTVLNGRWVARVFAKHRHPNSQKAAHVLNSLQQAPLRISTDEGLLASLIFLPHNDEWWTELVAWLDYTYTWSISAIASIAWVVIAYVFTILDYFSRSPLDADDPNYNGQGVGSIGSLWLWLLCIVVGWLQISPKCDSIRLDLAFERANRLAHAATPSSKLANTSLLTKKQAFSIDLSERDNARRDERCTAPIYNYARYLPWVESVMIVSDAFENASERMVVRQAVTTGTEWVGHESDEETLDMKTLPVEEYSFPILDSEGVQRQRRTLDGTALYRMVIASAVALVMQWGTTASAIIIVWFTPTIGLGCRSASYILYGLISTVIWSMLLTSSILTYYSTNDALKGHPMRPIRFRIGRWVSIFLRRTGKFLAVLNSAWIVALGLLEFGNVFDTCYCNSSVLGLGKNAYNVIVLTSDDIPAMRSSWIWGFCLAGGVVVGFVVFVNLFIDSQESS